MNPTILMAGALGLVAAFGVGVWTGIDYEHNANEARQRAAEIAAETLEDEQESAATGITASVSVEVETDLAAGREITRRLSNEVSNNVTDEDDAACPVPPGAGRLWDASIRAELPGVPRTASQSDDYSATSDFALALSDIIATDIVNNGRHHGCRAGYIGLQNWVRQQRDLARQFEDRRKPP